MNSEAFERQRTDLQEAMPDVSQVLESHTQLTLNAMVHGSDVGNHMKPWDLAERLAHLCVDEFFAQGDLEKAAGIPVQMLNDRDKVNRPNSQIGFIEFMIAPMVEAMICLFPQLDELALNLGSNIQSWYEVWCEETSPAPEAAEKVNARVGKVMMRCQNLMRGGEGEGMTGHGTMRISWRSHGSMSTAHKSMASNAPSSQ